MNYLIRSSESPSLEINKPKRTIVHVVGSDALDRHKTVIEPWGLDFDKFMGDPRQKDTGPVLWEHGKDVHRGTLPVAECMDLSQGRHGGLRCLMAKTRFLDIDEGTEKLWKLYADRKLRGWSVGIIADQSAQSPPTREEISRRPELRNCVMVYGKGELTEYSATTIPSNTTAQTVAVERSLMLERSLATSVSPNIPPRFASIIAEYRAAMRQANAQSAEMVGRYLEAKNRGATDAELLALLKRLELEYAVEITQSRLDNHRENEARKKAYAIPLF